MFAYFQPASVVSVHSWCGCIPRCACDRTECANLRAIGPSIGFWESAAMQLVSTFIYIDLFVTLFSLSFSYLYQVYQVWKRRLNIWFGNIAATQICKCHFYTTMSLHLIFPQSMLSWVSSPHPSPFPFLLPPWSASNNQPSAHYSIDRFTSSQHVHYCWLTDCVSLYLIPTKLSTCFMRA